MMKKIISILLLGLSASAQAALYDRGNGLIYDDQLNVTIMQDANLFKTLAGNDSSLVSNIISANNGVIHDTANVFDGGTRTITSADFTASSGAMTWWGAQAFIGYLNNINYDGYNDWRLPINSPVDVALGFNYNTSFNGSSDIGWNIKSTNSELAYLFNVDLNLINKYVDTVSPTLTNSISNSNPNGLQIWSGVTAPTGFQDKVSNSTANFSNVQNGNYWSGTEGTNPVNQAMANQAFNFYVHEGDQMIINKTSMYNAWVFRSADVTAVPLPASVWLFLSAILGFMSFKRNRKG